MKEIKELGEVSDGYHTFKELYDHRITLFIVLCKKIYNDKIIDVWRSKKHSDGTMFDGWFVMGINKCKCRQISYHIPLDKWKLINFAETLEFAPEWDGHKSDDVRYIEKEVSLADLSAEKGIC